MASSGVARVGDTGHSTVNCSLHSPNPLPFTYTWTTGSTTVDILGVFIIRVGDTTPSSCGHTVVATTGAGSSGDNGHAIHRVGDQVAILEGGTGQGVTDTGSNIVDAA